MSERTQSLKKNVVIKTHRLVSRGLERERGSSEGSPFRQEMEVGLCMDRARLITEAYKQNEHEPMVIKRAKAFVHILENMTIYIEPRQVLVGNFASSPNKVAHYPDLQWRWLEKTICTPNGAYKDLLSNEEKDEMISIHKYWKTRAVHGMERDLIPESSKEHLFFKGLSFWAYQWDMGTPNYEKVFTIGLNGIARETDERLRQLDQDYEALTISPKDYLDQRRDLTAMRITLEGTIKWAERYSQLAMEMAADEEDGERKEELEKIADICKWVPANPCRTFHEALQCFWFIHLLVGFIEEPQVGSGTRFDKIFYPFYRKDLDAGRITRDQAQELLEHMWVNFLSTGFLHPPVWSGSGGGGLGWQTVTIGGVDSKGEDITNEITYLVLDSIKEINMLQPPLALRVHEKTPRELLLKATEVLSTGVSQPAFFNDRFNIPRLVSFGVPEEEARDYAINSCMWPVIPGKNIVHRNPTAGSVMVPKALELALNQGKDIKTGEQLGVSTKDPSDLKSIDEIMGALLDQIDFAARGLFSISNIANRLYEEYLQRPFLSALLDGCIERGQELRKWTYMPYSDVMMIGGINAADSLTAIKKLVFDDKKLTIENLITALKNNWKGAEELRQMCLNAPKFGNDEDYADLVVKELYEKIAERLSRIKTYTSGQWVPGIVDGSAATLHYGYSGLTAATPDGRFAGETFADGSISPIMGRDKNGPTAVLMSLSKLDHRKLWNTLHNQTFSPLYLQDQFAGVFTDYLRTWADIGSHHIQFSVVDSETLKAAQKRPQEYHELIVRVCGFSAYFIDLSEGLQNTIIDRTLQCIG